MRKVGRRARKEIPLSPGPMQSSSSHILLLLPGKHLKIILRHFYLEILRGAMKKLGPENKLGDVSGPVSWTKWEKWGIPYQVVLKMNSDDARITVPGTEMLSKCSVMNVSVWGKGWYSYFKGFFFLWDSYPQMECGQRILNNKVRWRSPKLLNMFYIPIN